MNNSNLLKLIRESRPLLNGATIEQKLQLLKLIRESINAAKNKKQIRVHLSETADYLEEK